MNNNKWKIGSIKLNYVLNVFLRLSSTVFALITMPYISRVLGADGTGKVSFATSVVSYFIMFSQLGIPTYGIRTCASCRDNEKELSKTVKELFNIGLISTIISYIAFFLIFFLVPKFQEEKMLLLITSSSIFLTTIGMDWFFQAVEQYTYITKRNLFFKIVGVVSVFVMIHKPQDYIIYGVIMLISSYGPCVVNYFYAKKLLDNSNSIRLEYRRHLKPIVTFFALSIAVSIYSSMDSVMLGFISGDTQVGYYNLGTKTKLILATMITSIGTVLLPRVAYYIGNGENEKFKEVIKKSFSFVIISSLAVCAFFCIMARDTVAVLGGNEFMEAVPCMRAITIAIIPLTLGNIACMQILAPLKKEKYTMYSTFCGACINLVMNFVLIPRFGALGAAIATSITETIVMMIQVYCAREYLITAIKNVKYIKIGGALITGILLLMILLNAIKTAGLIRLIIGAIVFFTSYTIMLILTKEEFTITILEPIKQRIFKQ